MPTTPLSSIPPTPLQHLLPPYLPLGHLTLLVGPPASAKSLLACHLAAALSTGRPPFQPSDFTLQPSLPPASTLLLSLDSPSSTLRPRLEALHADLSRIHLRTDLRSLFPSRNRHIKDPIDLLESTLNDHPDIRLLIIDSLPQFLGRSDPTHHRDPSLPRTLLASLSKLAADRHIAILLLSHLTRTPSLHKLLNSPSPCIPVGGGHNHLTPYTPSILLLTPDSSVEPSEPIAPAGPSDHSPARADACLVTPPTPSKAPAELPSLLGGERRSITSSFLLIPIKSSLTSPPPILRLTLHAAAGASPTLVLDPTPIDPDSLTPPKRRPLSPEAHWAVEWLTDRLSSGPQPYRDLRTAAKETADISPSALLSAKYHLNIQSAKQPAPPGKSGARFWQLPDDPTPLPEHPDFIRQREHDAAQRAYEAQRTAQSQKARDAYYARQKKSQKPPLLPTNPQVSTPNPSPSPDDPTTPSLNLPPSPLYSPSP